MNGEFHIFIDCHLVGMADGVCSELVVGDKMTSGCAQRAE